MTLPLVGAGLTRRLCLQSSVLAGGLFLTQEQAQAGGQVEEPISDAVRNAMSAALHSDKPLEPIFHNTEARMHYVRWKMEMNRRLVSRKSDLRTLQDRDDFLQTVWYNSKRAQLDVGIVLGLIQVESNFRKRAISSVGARGYMQVMPFWMRALPGGNVDNLFQMGINIRFGCMILREYLTRENGDLFLALGRYNGSRGKAPYPNVVLGAKKSWEFNG
jgi:soluble lytic murein transglycosylase-like protein